MAKNTSNNTMLHRRSSKSKSEKTPQKDVRTGSLGIGDAFAYGVRDLVEKMKSEQGSSQTQWLGVSKESIDAKDCVDRQKLTCKGKK